MRTRSFELLLAALFLVAAWGLLFLAQVMSAGAPAAVPLWVPLILCLAGGVLAVLSRPSRLTATGFGLVLALTLTGLVLVHLAGARGEDLEAEWRHDESLRLAQTLMDVGEAVEKLEGISASIGQRVGAYVLGGGYDRTGLTPGGRVEAFERLDSLAAGVSESGSLPQGTEIGIQLYDAQGKLVAWAGWPQLITQRERAFMATGKELTYSREVSLYRILTHVIPIVDNRQSRAATVLVDMPLEVNFRVNNRFLKSTSIAENISTGRVASLSFDYFPVRDYLPNRLEAYKRDQDAAYKRRESLTARRAERLKRGTEAKGTARADSMLFYYPFPSRVEPLGDIVGDAAAGLTGRVMIRSPQGNPIMNVTANSHPFSHFLESRQTHRLLWGKTFIVLALVVLFIHAMVAIGRGGRLAWLRAVLLVVFLVVLRYSLLTFQALSPAAGGKVFDPTVFATPLLGGIMRSAGDLMFTGLFAVAALYGLLKTLRSREENAGTRGPVLGETPAWLFAAKGVFTAFVLAGAFEVARRFTNIVVVNANPRLIGETMQLTDAGVLALHLGTFLTLAGILLAGVFAVWGVFKLTGWSDLKKSALVALAFLVVLAVSGRWESALVSGVLLAFLVFTPRFVQREDLVSIVMVSFFLVIISSGSAYLFLSRDYDELRKNFIEEKANELINPSDNWKVVILEDVLEEFSRKTEIRQALRQPGSEDVQRLAFDLWASGPLSLLGYSTSIYVLTARDSVISDFAVDMPYRVRIPGGNERIDTPVENDWIVLDLTRNTPRGIVRYYRGILNIEEARVDLSSYEGIVTQMIGKVVVDLPFFFESLEWAAQTGPRTPEVLRNVQEGGVAPRVEEPEALLLARVEGRRIYETSSENLPVGFTVPEALFERGLERGWPLLNTGRGQYRFLIQETDEPGRYLLAGFVTPSPVRHILRWSTLLSLYLFFTVVVLTAIVLLSRIPLLKEILPTLTPGRKLGFQQKLLVSFLVMALVPAVILGVFSANFIKARFLEENRQEALTRAFSARKAIVNLLRGEMDLFMNQVDVNRLFTEEGYGERLMTGTRLVKVFNEAGEAGVAAAPGVERESRPAGPGQRQESGTPGGAAEQAGGLFVGSLADASTEDVYLLRSGGAPYIGVLSPPMLVTGADWSGYYYLFFARRVEPRLLGEIAEQAGAEVNIYDNGRLVSSSHEGLLAGGFISAIMNADAFVKVSLMESDRSLATERAGRYNYQVAYLPITSWGGGIAGGAAGGAAARDGDTRTAVRPIRAAMSVPLVFRPESYYLEVQKATSIVLGIFALLFAATIALGLLMARGIFEPLRGLLAGTRRIIGGDLNVRLPSRRSDDEIGIVVSAFNEMTAQLSRSQQALEERRRYLETILANIGTGVISTDADGSIHTVNRAAGRILGIDAGNAVGRTVDEFAGEGKAKEIFALLRDSKNRKEPFVAAEIEIMRDGRRATVKYMMTRLQSENRYMGTVFVFEDLTELIQSKKLSAWVEMARQIAHEIKNPLTPIRISTQFMQRAYEQKSEQFDQIFKESSETIIQQVDVLKRIAGEFSSYGRMQQLEVKAHKLAPLVTDIITPYERNPAGVRITYENGIPEAVVLADTEAVRKICSNLIENAMEAMPDGGTLAVACREETVRDERLVRVSFRDSGPGLSPEVEEKLFEPYFSTKTTGTGLGLAICRSLSHEMGGDVEVRNVPGGGVEASLLLRLE